MEHLPDILWTAVQWLALWIVPLAVAAWGLHWLIQLPLRRQERGRMVLDLIETGLQSGRSPEQTLVEAGRTRDPMLGAAFFELAAHLESGLSLPRALEQMPGFLPPPIHGMLLAALETGALPKVLPACRRTLSDGLSQMRSAINYQVLMLFLLNPMLLLVLPFLSLKIFPVYLEIYAGFGHPLPPLMRLTHEWGGFLFLFQLASFAALFMGSVFFVGGPRLRPWLEAGLYPVTDWLVYLIPWKQKRMLRDFSATLAVLLDARLPESRAVLLAARVTGNRVFLLRAERAVKELESGRTLAEVVARMDDTGEFHWRLANAAHGLAATGGFVQSLEGWHEALDAQAFQQEQAAAQFLSTGLAISNGLVVAVVCLANWQAISYFYTLPIPPVI
ncbi:MAG: type II secretion system F family protein [Verrucomicrobiota bacterium]